MRELIRTYLLNGLAPVLLFSLMFITTPVKINAQAPAEVSNSSSGSGFPLELTWVDVAFAHFYPLAGTRLDDFSKVNYGGMGRLNFMLFDIEPLWLSTAVMIQRHTPDIHRIETLTDYSFSIGAGWRFAFRDWGFHGGYMNRWYFTPRYDYGFLLHVTYGDYYDDPDIYPADPRAGEVKTRYFSDMYQMVEFELAYDLTPTLKTTSWGRGIMSEIFFSPSVMFFPEQDRHGYEYGYLLGIRMKGGIADAVSILAGNVVDDETGEVIATALPRLDKDIIEEEQATGNETFAYKINPDESYVLTAVAEGYAPASVTVNKDELQPDQRKNVTIRLKRLREWGIYGNVYIKETKEPIEGVAVYAIESNPGEPAPLKNLEDIELHRVTERVGGFRMKLKENTHYDVIFKSEGFFTLRGQFDTTGKDPGWYPVNEYMKIMLQEALSGQKIDFDNIYYDTAKWDIRKDSEPVLNSMTQFLWDNPNIVVELSAHTDSRGPSTSNQTLSQKRAQSAVSYIVNKGIDKDRISAKGYGEEKIMNRCVDGVNCSGEEHQLNRRTEFRVRKILN